MESSYYKVIGYLYCLPLLELKTAECNWSLPVEKVYRDRGGRLALKQLWEICQKQPPEYLLLRSLAELGDSIVEISDRLSQLETWGINVIAQAEGYDSSRFNSLDPAVSQQNLIKLLQAIELKHKSLALQRGHAHNRLKHLPPPGKAPYGYRRGQEKYILDRSTAPVVKDFFEQFLLFGSVRRAAKYLETRYGKKISPSTAKKWLTNPVYRGDLAYKDGVVINNTHVPILSREEAAQIDRLLRRNRRLPPRTASAPRSLAGLVKCSECQSCLTITQVIKKHKAGKYLYLRSPHCPKQPKCKAVAYQAVLEKLIEQICQALPLAIAQTKPTDLDLRKESLQAEIKQKQLIIRQLTDLETQGILDLETSNLRSYKLQGEIAKLTEKLAQLPPITLDKTVQTVSIPQFWLDLSESERRFYFREFIKEVILIRQEKTK